ncbi:MAG: c-type cytochrome, partial [Gammaproteobacteria bacterium]|nr:c-type cytochrome [Gammaproteobacteria bacterium]
VLSTGGGGTPPPVPSNGEQLYINLCQSCHGFNGTGGSANAIVGVSESQISSSIFSVGSMQGILLTGTDAQEIAIFLSSGGGTLPPPTTGEEIYAVKCAACHGPAGTGGSEGEIIGADLHKIQEAMLAVDEMRPIPLTNGEAQAVATYLASDSDSGGGTPPSPTTGGEIYAVKCAACHGPAGTGGSEGEIIGADLHKIQEAMLAVDEMRPIPLTNGEAQAIAAYLASDDDDD